MTGVGAVLDSDATLPEATVREAFREVDYRGRDLLSADGVHVGTSTSTRRRR